MSCDFAPDCSATAVREPLVDTAKPWKKPAATLAAPMPIISWLGCSSSPRRAAKADAVAMVSVSDTSTMPIAARSSGPTSLNDVHGSDGVGNPCGSVPTVATPWAARSSTADTIVAPTTAISTAGILRQEARQHEQHDEHAQADGERGALGGVEVLEPRAQLVDEAVGVGGEAAQLRELPHDDGDGEAVHVTDLHLARQQVGDEPELAEPESDLDETDEQGQHPRERDRASRVVRHQERA